MFIRNFRTNLRENIKMSRMSPGVRDRERARTQA